MVDDGIRNLVAKQLVALGRRWPKHKIHDFVHGTLRLTPVALTLKGKHAWDRLIPTICQSHRLAAATQGDTYHLQYKDRNPAHAVDHAVYPHMAVCVNCNQESPSHPDAFQLADLDFKIKCKACPKATPSRGWKCICGSLWHICPRHGHVHVAHHDMIAHPTAFISSQIGSRNTTRKRKALLNEGAYQDILDDELSREAKRAKKEYAKADGHTIMLNAPLRGTLRASWLPPKLRERFASSLAVG